ncbi:hypothetical protein SLEP1_g29893 [Rubroshorea leprosula]|uniref:Uncharacterized protein n=1 Tax=Rubroshorea leprosula TaxID=152421 RepID=A0AAV5K4U2_9ROSI|nr:hypothetical protein SLEP1_g29893 [Rubroshorea leprosula]
MADLDFGMCSLCNNEWESRGNHLLYFSCPFSQLCGLKCYIRLDGWMHNPHSCDAEWRWPKANARGRNKKTGVLKGGFCGVKENRRKALPAIDTVIQNIIAHLKNWNMGM